MAQYFYTPPPPHPKDKYLKICAKYTTTFKYIYIKRKDIYPGPVSQGKDGGKLFLESAVIKYIL
jgi:hypothetical protein